MTSLAAAQLDDLEFDDLTSATIERIPAESGGRWTLHAPVDPGITLLELFGYLLDQRVFWLGQVPDATLRGIFALLGESPALSRCATTVMRLTGPSVAFHAGVRLSLVGRDPAVEFTTTSDIALLPVGSVGVEVLGVDRTPDLVAGRGVDLMPHSGGWAEARIVLGTDAALPAAPGASAAVLLRLAPSEPTAQWLADSEEPGVPPPADVTWLARNAAGDLAPLAVEDGTGGLRRSGIVRFEVPADWAPDGRLPNGQTAYSVHVRTEHATWTAPPRLVEVVPNVVVAEHRAPRMLEPAALEQQVANWLPLPSMKIDCGAAGLLREDPETLHLTLRERDGEHTWEATPDLATAGPDSRAFTVDRALGTITFGDGMTGRVPVLDGAAPRARVDFEVGGGPAGNVGANLDWEAPEVTGLTAKNVVAAEGGAEPETLDAARERVAAALTKRERTVTAVDHETVAKATPGVAIKRAHAAVGFHPAYPCTPVPGAVTVFVVPTAPRETFGDRQRVPDPKPDPGALRAVARHLEEWRLIGSEVFVQPPRYRNVRLSVTVRSEPPDGQRLQSVLDRELRKYLDPLVGGEDGFGWPFGDDLRPSALLRRAQVAVGTEADVVSVAVGIDGNEPDQSCRDVAIGANDLVVATEVGVRWTPSGAAEGGLR